MSEIEVLSRTQKIIVSATRSVRIVGAGPVGPRGLTGAPGSATNVSYRHSQDSPLQVWLVVHNLGYEPAGILAYELVGIDEYVEVKGDIVHINDNMFTIQYDAAIAGYVIVS